MALNQLIGDGMRSLLGKGVERSAPATAGVEQAGSQAIKTTETDAVGAAAKNVARDLAQIQSDIALALPKQGLFEMTPNLKITDVKALPLASDAKKQAVSFVASFTHDGRDLMGDTTQVSGQVSGIYDPLMRDTWSQVDRMGAPPTPFFNVNFEGGGAA